MSIGQIIGLVISILCMLTVFVGMVCEFIIENNEYRRRNNEKQKELEDKEHFIAEIYSYCVNLRINNYILRKNEDKYLRQIALLKSRIKKYKELKGEKK